MTRTSPSFSLSLELPTLKLCELYEVTLRDGNTYYYTDHPVDYLWNSQTYTALPITRDPINFNLNLETDTVKVYLAGISGDLVTYVQANNLDDAEVTIKRIHWNTGTYASDDELIVFKGNADVSFNRNLLTLELRPWIDSLNLQVPAHTYQEPCNWRIYEDGCGLKQSSFSYTGTATNGNQGVLIDVTRGLLYKLQFDGGDVADTIHKGELVTGGVGAGTALVVNVMYESDGSGRLWYCELNGTQFVDDETLLGSGGGSVTVNGAPEENLTLYERGELHVTTGNNAGQRRPILSDQSYNITPFWPFPNDVVNGDSYKVYPGCDGRAAETCRSWYDQDDNFRGYLYIPAFEEMMM
jgi:hypothetical protein